MENSRVIRKWESANNKAIKTNSVRDSFLLVFTSSAEQRPSIVAITGTPSVLASSCLERIARSKDVLFLSSLLKDGLADQVSVLCLNAPPYDEMLSSGVRAIGIPYFHKGIERKLLGEVLSVLRAVNPTHVILRVPLYGILKTCLKEHRKVLPFSAFRSARDEYLNVKWNREDWKNLGDMPKDRASMSGSAQSTSSYNVITDSLTR